MDTNRMQPIYDNQESFESALDKAWKSYNESGARTVDSCEDNYTECAYAKGFREGYLFGLEKQKEHMSCPDAPKEKSDGGDFYSSDKDKNLDEIVQDYVDGVKQYNQEPTWDLMQTAVCYGYHLSEEQFEKNRLAHCDALSKEDCDRETDFAMEIIEKEHRHPTFNDAINYGMRLQNQKEQKPAEWGEEDEKIRKALVWHLKADVDFVSNGVTKAECLAYLDKQKAQKQEWSEEDEHILKGIIGLVDHDQHYGVSNKEMLDWLKSLRPSWKPSKEQMEAPNEIVNILEASPFLHQNDYLFNILNGLREELKNYFNHEIH